MPPPYESIHYDIKEALEETKQKILTHYYKNDYEFHNNIHSLFSKLRDGHTQYTPPSCYSFFSMVLPFPLKSSLEPILNKETGEREVRQVIRIGKV